MVRGRRTRVSDTAVAVMNPTLKRSASNQLKVSTVAAAIRKDCRALRKPSNSTAKNAFSDYGIPSSDSIVTITRRTRHLRKSLQSIQKQFDNQAITKFFQVKVKTNLRSFDDNDENACDAFGAQEVVVDLSAKNDVEIDEHDAMMLYNNNSHDNTANRRRRQPKSNNTVAAVDVDDDNDGDGDDEQNSNGSSHSASSHNSIQPSNIFLQKPVLHLKIDKSLRQSSSIVINKQLDVCPNFSAPFSMFNNSIACGPFPNALTTAQNNNNHLSDINDDNNTYCANANEKRMETSDESPMRSEIDAEQMDDKSKPQRRKLIRKRVSGSSDGGLADALNNSDSNSCDSGVVIDKSLELNGKPTTPHRIVCPSSNVAAVAQVKPEPNAVPKRAIMSPRTRGMHSQRRLRAAETKSLFAKLASVQNATQTEASSETDNDKPIKQEMTSDGEAHQEAEKCDEIAPESKPIATNSVIKMSVSRAATPVTVKVQSKQLTDYFPVRRSIRKTKRTVEQEYLRHIEKAIESQCEDGLVVKVFKDKGRGICAGRPFKRNEFVVEYIGDLIEQNEADRREEMYAKDTTYGCYMYYFKHKEQQWCIDATAESGKLGRLVNHSRNGNLVTKIVTYKNRPHLVLIAKEDIKEGEEFTYDYGDRTRESLINHPWLAL